jgi:D-lactate dehydrogenase
VDRYDEFQSDEMKAMGMEYVDRETLFRESDIISLHIPLLPNTRHIIDRCLGSP